MTSDESGRLILGLSLPDAQDDAATALRSCRTDGYDFCTTGLLSNHVRSDCIELDSWGWSHCVVGMIIHSGGTDLALQLEVARFLNLPAVLMPPLAVPVHEYATWLGQMERSSCQLWIPVTLTEESLRHWLQLQMQTGLSQTAAALVFQPHPLHVDPIMHTAQQLRLLHIFLGVASVKAIIVPTDVFLTNKRQYPTLTKSHQLIFSEILRRVGRTIRVLVHGTSRHVNLSDGILGVTKARPYAEYLQHLRTRPEVTSVMDSEEARLDSSYLDALQMPLQPLKDHLEFRTYEVFEKDPVKYVEYQRAVAMALNDRANLPECVVLVVGAGRGPLVTCVLQAYLSQTVRPAKLTVWAIEKNPSAVMVLNSKCALVPAWVELNVQVVCKDLRELQLADIGNKPCDIVVSELLGSFGDNELSPECLDALFQSVVCKSNSTISIPSHYVNHIAPLSSVELYNQSKNQALFPDKTDNDVIGLQTAMETPYVVRTHSASQMCPEQDCWTFSHPPATNADRNRHKVLTFAAHAVNGTGCGNGYGPRDTTMENIATSHADAVPVYPTILTGLVGTFTAELYSRFVDGREEAARISTAPSTFSVGMFSWFPLFFPLHEPVYVPPNAHVRVYLWRKAEAAKVWYEWSVAVYRDEEVLSMTSIHNPGGRSSFVSL